MKNIYFGMRHGESMAQKCGIILSDPRDGKLPEFGLTPLGRAQAFDAATNGKKMIPPGVIVISSDFSRAIETAKIASPILGARYSFATWHLRERYFGIFERMGKENYQKVWEEDAITPNYSGHEGESVNDVLDRILPLIARMEEDYADKNILLVSHGDTLQILECYFKGISGSRHREMKNFENAEIRRFV